MPEPFNPYAPPATSDAPPPTTEDAQRPRSRVPLVCGILSITFSGVFLVPLLIGVGGAVYYTTARPPAEAPATQPAKPSARTREPLSDSAAAVLGLAVVLLTPALLVLGIGQVRYKRWTSIGTKVWAALALLSLAATVLLSSAPADRAMSLVRAGPLIMFMAPYPIVLLSLYSRRVEASLRR